MKEETEQALLKEGNTIVRKNLLSDPSYSPYCGDSCHRMPRTHFNGEQFVCESCGWVSDFPTDFIAYYKAKWSK